MGQAKARGESRFTNPKGPVYKLLQTGTKYKRHKAEAQQRLYNEIVAVNKRVQARLEKEKKNSLVIVEEEEKDNG